MALPTHKGNGAHVPTLRKSDRNRDGKRPNHAGRRTPLACALSAAVLASSLWLADGAQAAGPARELRPFPSVALKGRVRGQDAVSQLGKRLPEVAAWYGLTVAQFTRILTSDRTAWLDRNARLHFVDELKVEQATTSTTTSISGAAPYPLDQTFLLHSRPGAKRTLYIHFQGAAVTGTSWNGSYGLQSIVAAAFDLDGNASDFNTTERETIQSIWQRVAEDYAPFDVDVTTEEPTADRLTRSSSTDDTFGSKVIVTRDWTQATASPCGCGGFAYLGVYDDVGDYYKPAFVFFNQLGNGNEKYVAEAVSHEAGHNLGLSHDGYNNGTTVQSYYAGHGSGATSWAPIMGNSYSRTVTQWSKGEYPYATQTEDDLTVMQTYGAPLRPDDYGNDIASATPLNWSGGPSTITLSGSGVISTRTDVDVFSFYSAGGAIALDVNPSARGPNLDIQATLMDVMGNALVAANSTSALGASISISNAPAGTYFLKVDGVGYGDAATGYSDYASLGQYSIAGTITQGSAVNQPPTALATVSATSGTAPLSLTFSSAGSSDPEGGALSYEWNFGDGSPVSTSPTPSYMYSTAGSYTATLTVRDPQGAAGTSSVSIVVKAPPPPASTVMHVGNIGMSLAANKRSYRAAATVKLVDGNGVPVSGATVAGKWTGLVTGNVSGTTATDGTVTLNSGWSQRTGSFTFTVTGVTKAGNTYNSSANVETFDSISR